MRDERIDVLYTSNTSTRGILGIDWSEKDLGDLASLAAMLQQLPPRVRRLECSLCLGRAQEVTPVNVYRRMRLRIRQIENTMAHNANLEEIQVRFYVTRNGTQPTVETVEVTPVLNRGLSARLQYFLIRNRLLHRVQVLAEPPNHRRLESSSSSSFDAHAAEEHEAATTLVVTTSPKERHAIWGRAILNIVQRRDVGLTSSSTYTLLQKNVDYLPCCL